MEPRIPRPLVLLAFALAFAGCGRSGFRPFELTAPTWPRTVVRPSWVDAVVAPDSVAAGETIRVKVHVYEVDCESFLRFETSIRADTLVVVPIDHVIVQGDCPGHIDTDERDCVVTPPRAGRWTILVAGAPASGRFVLPVVVGAAPATLRRYELRIVDAVTRKGLPHFPLTILRGTVLDFTRDTLATLVTDDQGSTSLTAPCGSDTTAYDVLLEDAEDPWYDFVWTPARCGVSERALYVVRSLKSRPPGMRRSLTVHYR